MKRISQTQRALNIFSKAAEYGYELDFDKTVEESIIEASDLLVENSNEEIEEYCPVNHGRNQGINWNDGMGFSVESWGELVQYDRFSAPETKYFHTTVVNSLGQVVKLYDTQGENSSNTQKDI